jgi:general secretion pathway protein K
MKARALPHQQRGVAIITALLLTTLAITIVASLFWEQQVQVRSIENQRTQLQMQWILRAALDWAALILREDARQSNVDTLDEPWATPLAETRLDQYVDDSGSDPGTTDTLLSGHISDAQARYNLTNLCPDGTINKEGVAAFARLLNNSHIDPALAEATAEMMAAAKAGRVPGTASPETQTGPIPMNLTQVDDLLAVPGFTPAILQPIRDFIIFLPNPTPINVNTAPAEVMAAAIDGLSLADANALVASRGNATFRYISDFAERLPENSISVSNLEASVATNYFLVDGKVRMNRAELAVQALVHRDGTNTQLIWIR